MSVDVERTRVVQRQIRTGAIHRDTETQRKGEMLFKRISSPPVTRVSVVSPVVPRATATESIEDALDGDGLIPVSTASMHLLKRAVGMHVPVGD